MNDTHNNHNSFDSAKTYTIIAIEHPKMPEKTKKYRLLKIIGIVILILMVALFFVFKNSNRIVSDVLHKSFNNYSISEVYELQFEHLSINIFEGSVKVYNVQMKPLANPLRSYPYINSSFILKTKLLSLENVNLKMLLVSNILKMDRILIFEPDMELQINSEVPIFFPFKEAVAIADKSKNEKSNTDFALLEFKLLDATIHTINTAAKREFNFQKLTISLSDLFIDQEPGVDKLTYKNISLTAESLEGNTQNEKVKYVQLSNLNFKTDSLIVQKSLDTLIYHFDDFNVGFSALNLHTTDSVFNFYVGDFNLSYKDKSIVLNAFSFKPNISREALQRKYKYVHPQVTFDAATIAIKNLQFDSLLYSHCIYIDEVSIDSVNSSLYKDKSKPINKNRFPAYLGQKLQKLPIPIQIKTIKVTHVNFINEEKITDTTLARVHVNRGTATFKNITNLETKEPFLIQAEGYIENKAHAFLELGFDYNLPQFSITGSVKPFQLKDINSLIGGYTPVKFTNGQVDEISFNGMAYKNSSTGTMKFLFHDLQMDLEVVSKGNWINNILGFAANAAIISNNPVAPDEPARIVKFSAERDVNKGFFNIFLRSILNGFKETIYMSKKNRKAFQKQKEIFEKNSN